MLSIMTLLVQMDIRNAMARIIPLMVISERPNRILTLLKLISTALESGRLTCVPISCFRADFDGWCSGISSS